MKKYKSKGKKRHRVLIAVGRMKVFLNCVRITLPDGREVPPRIPHLPIDRDQNLVIEWWE